MHAREGNGAENERVVDERRKSSNGWKAIVEPSMVGRERRGTRRQATMEMVKDVCHRGFVNDVFARQAALTPHF